MISSDDKKLQLFVQRAGRVSRALWPANARRSVATDRAAQQRRSLILNGQWWAFLPIPRFFTRILAWRGGRLRRPASPGRYGSILHAPETPVPPEPPLVRVLETFDLSHTNVEHFLQMAQGGDTGELLIDRSEEQAAAYREE